MRFKSIWFFKYEIQTYEWKTNFPIIRHGGGHTEGYVNMKLYINLIFSPGDCPIYLNQELKAEMIELETTEIIEHDYSTDNSYVSNGSNFVWLLMRS